MLKEAIEYVLGLKKPEVVSVNGRDFSTLSLSEVPAESSVKSFTVNSLSGLVEYIKSTFDTDRKLMIHVKSPTEVLVFDALDATNNRRTYIEAEALLPKILFGGYVERETFQIMLQANFCNNEDKEGLLNIVSSMAINDGTHVHDSGITQTVTVKTGIDLDYKVVPERLTLMPFRTFHEVDQPASDFIFRTRDNRGVIECGLFEADGGAWELNAMHFTAAYIKENLSEEIEKGSVLVIS